jgi:hypothetical protein
LTTEFFIAIYDVINSQIVKTTKEEVMSDSYSTKQKYAGIEVARKLSDTVNSFDNYPVLEGFVSEVCDQTHRTLQANIGRLIFACIRRWAEHYSHNRYDLRNEALCKSCRRIVEYMDKEHEYWDHLPRV